LDGAAGASVFCVIKGLSNGGQWKEEQFLRAPLAQLSELQG
jgi:hypothetical protein